MPLCYTHIPLPSIWSFVFVALGACVCSLQCDRGDTDRVREKAQKKIIVPPEEPVNELEKAYARIPGTLQKLVTANKMLVAIQANEEKDFSPWRATMAHVIAELQDIAKGFQESLTVQKKLVFERAVVLYQFTVKHIPSKSPPDNAAVSQLYTNINGLRIPLKYRTPGETPPEEIPEEEQQAWETFIDLLLSNNIQGTDVEKAETAQAAFTTLGR